MCRFVTINANSNMGDFVLCNIYSSIGKNCFLATRVSLLPCVNLEDNCIVSAGSSIISKNYTSNQLIFHKNIIKTRKKQ